MQAAITKLCLVMNPELVCSTQLLNVFGCLVGKAYQLMCMVMDSFSRGGEKETGYTFLKWQVSFEINLAWPAHYDRYGSGKLPGRNVTRSFCGAGGVRFCGDWRVCGSVTL